MALLVGRRTCDVDAHHRVLSGAKILLYQFPRLVLELLPPLKLGLVGYQGTFSVTYFLLFLTHQELVVVE